METDRLYRVQKEDLPELEKLLTACFREDPLYQKLIPDDEPTGNLDRRNSEEIIRLLKESNRRQKQTLIVITHDESIALQADRMLAIEDGRITRDERIRIAGGEFS